MNALAITTAALSTSAIGAELCDLLNPRADWSRYLSDEQFDEAFGITAEDYRAMRSEGWIIAVSPSGPRSLFPGYAGGNDANEIECFGVPIRVTEALVSRGFRYRPLPGWVPPCRRAHT